LAHESSIWACCNTQCTQSTGSCCYTWHPIWIPWCAHRVQQPRVQPTISIPTTCTNGRVPSQSSLISARACQDTYGICTAGAVIVTAPYQQGRSDGHFAQHPVANLDSSHLRRARSFRLKHARMLAPEYEAPRDAISAARCIEHAWLMHDRADRAYLCRRAQCYSRYSMRTPQAYSQLDSYSQQSISTR
jgi:hypothetical protein